MRRVEAALLKVAALVDVDPAFTPVFERLEAELEEARTRLLNMTPAQTRARALLAQRAIEPISSAKCSSEAPRP